MEQAEDSAMVAVEQLIGILTTYGLNVIGAILILIIGVLIAGRLRRVTERALDKIERFDPTLSKFLSSLVRYIVLAVTVVAVLERFGVQTTSLIAVLGAAGLAVGLALQGTLSNVAAGVMLLIFRPLKIGDSVEVAGHRGSVKGITLFVTELASGDNVQIIIPNASVWGAAVKNYSFHSTRRIDFTIGVGYGDDLDKAASTIQAVIAADIRCLKDPEPLIAVAELADSSVNFAVRVWCRNSDYGSLKFALTKAFKEGLDRAGISIPFPQRDIHVFKEDGA